MHHLKGKLTFEAGFTRKGKIIQAGPLAFAQWVAAIDHAFCNLADGCLTEAELKTLWEWDGVYHESDDTLPGVPTPVAPETLNWRLVQHRLLEQTGPGLLQVHDYADYQLTRAGLEARRERDRLRKRRVRAGPRGFQKTPPDVQPPSRGSRSNGDSPVSVPVHPELGLDRSTNQPRLGKPAKGSLAWFLANLPDATERTAPAILTVVRKWRLPEAALWAALDELNAARTGGTRIRNKSGFFVSKLNEYGTTGRYAA